MKVAPRDINKYVANVGPGYRAVLVFGRDEGMVRERADKISKQISEDLSDPFQVARPTPGQLKEIPSILLDELAAISMMGGRRLVRLDGAGNESTDAVKLALSGEQGDGLLVITAGDLKPTSSLRKLCEKEKNALSIVCYEDSARDVMELIREILGANGLQAEQDAVTWLVGHLGSDRMVSRSELEKLALYKGTNGGSVTLADVQAVVGDTAALEISEISAAVTAGNMKALEVSLERAMTAGESPIAILRVLQGRLARLHLARGHTDRGMSAAEAVGKLRPPVFFMEKDAFVRLVSRWPIVKINQAMEIILEAEQQCKTTGMPAETITARALLRIAKAARG